MRIVPTVLVMIAALFAAPVWWSVPVHAAQIIPTVQDILWRSTRASSSVLTGRPQSYSSPIQRSPRSPSSRRTSSLSSPKNVGATALYATDENENVLVNTRLVVTHELAELQEALKSVIPQAGVAAERKVFVPK